MLTIGSFIFSFAVNAVIIQQNFVMGGVFGAGLMIHYVTDLLTPGTWFFIINTPMLILGWFLVSRRFLLYTLYASTLIFFFSEVITFDLGIKNQFYAVIIGGAINGFGNGLILKTLGSCGGLDIIAVIFNNKFNIGIGRTFLVYNGLLFIVASSFYETDLLVASFILVFVTSISLEYAMGMFNQRKSISIITEKGDEISNIINQRLNLGVTMMDGKGAYSKKDKKVLLVITNNIKLKRIEELVFNIDEDALFIVENTSTVIGSSFGKRKLY